MGKIIAFDNIKGGVGKTTIAVNLAVLLHDMGYRVAMLDADKQRHSRKAIRDSEPEIAVRTADTPAQVTKELKALSSCCDFIIADGPGGDAKGSIALLLCADIVLVPLQPSGFDFWSTVKDEGDLIEAVQETRRNQGKKKLRVHTLLNGVKTNTVVSREFFKLIPLLEHRGMPPLKTRIKQTQAFVNATFGKQPVVFRTKGSTVSAKRNIQELLLEVMVEKLRCIRRSSFESKTAKQRRRVANA